ncbi:amidohydrolase [uncultured Ilyobacter sp.]|uniref:amidohydrolase n=1 Tax=uncultured Ilyobacter sp. TaxID=544433 RepID=UPI0029F4D160|nr:amidohydrolase [uncultured Ilyobacter sp.]
MVSMIIKNINILTMNKNKDIIENGVLVIKDNLIFDIGDENLLKKYYCENIIDGEEGILIPGMINTHTHTSMVVFRSLGDDVKNRLKRYLFPLEKILVDKDLVYLGAKYGIMEMLLGGVTTFTDMYYYEDQVARAAKEFGIRGVLGETIVDFPSPDSKEPYGGLEYSKWFIEKWMDDDLITPAVAPHAIYTNDKDSLQKASELSKKYNIPMMMHVAEMGYELEECEKKYNMTPVEYLDSIGVLNERFISAHSILVTEKDIDLLHKKRVGISHNIGANSKGAKGVAPISDMCKRDMKIGLGTDGPMSGNTLDVLTQMPLVGKIHKLFNEDRSIFPANEILEMATIGGARVLNLDHEIGSVEIGKKADLVLFETESLNMQPIYDFYSVLVYSANPGNIDTVIVDGEILVKNKKLFQEKNNPAKIMEELKAIKKKILETADKL